MEIDDPECVESDSEEGHADKKNMAQMGEAGEEEEDEENEGEESGVEEEPQERVTVGEEDWYTCSEDEEEGAEHACGSSSESFHNSSRLMRKNELLDMFRSVHRGPTCKEGQLTVGLVSYFKKTCSEQVTYSVLGFICI